MSHTVYWLSYTLYSVARKLLRLILPWRSLRYVLGPVSGRMVYWLSGRRDQPLQVHGHLMRVASRGGYPPIDMTADQYERMTTQLIERLLSAGMVVCDIGAHVGYYSLLAARAVGATGKVYAFEPETGNHALLKDNIALNHYGEIIAAQALAVGNRTGSVTLHVSALDNGSHSLHHVGKPERESVQVQITTLDAFMAREGWPRVDLIKMDIEGNELQALEGMQETLARSEQLVMIVELCPSIMLQAGVTPVQMLEQLQQLSFRLFPLLESGMVSAEEAGLPEVLARLERTGDYLNLLCIKGHPDAVLEKLSDLRPKVAAR